MSHRPIDPKASATQVPAAKVASTKLGVALGPNIEVHADYAVWDSTNNKFLVEGKDYTGKDLNRS